MVSEGPIGLKIEAELCVSDLGGLFFVFYYRWPRSDVVVGYTSYSETKVGQDWEDSMKNISITQ